MKNCELCKLRARTYCESDQASLCWDCDAKVHGANFLVARHSRTLLCHVCHSLTPWTASGEKLGRTVSVCDSCIKGQEEEARQSNEDENDDNDGDDGEEVDEDDDDEEGDNQVVPLSTVTDTPPPPAYDSSNSSEDVSESVKFFPGKRRRVTVHASDLQFQDGRKYGTEVLTAHAESVESGISLTDSDSAAAIGEMRTRFRNQRDEADCSDANSWESHSRPI